MIGYNPKTTKHFCVWAPQTKQVIIASEPYIDESEKSAKLLAKWPLDVTQTKRKALAGDLKPRGRPQKNLIIKTRIKIPSPEVGDEEEEVAMSITKITSEIYEPRSYNKVVNNSVHDHC